MARSPFGRQDLSRKKTRLRPPKHKTGPAYRRVWFVVDGAVLDALKHHPEYIAQGKTRACRESITKRVTGAMLSFMSQDKEGRQ